MKIVFLNIFNGVVERGSEVFVENIATQLSDKHEILVYQIGKTTKKNYRQIQINGIPIFNSQQKVKSNRFAQFYYEQLYHFSVLFFTLKCIPHLWKEKPDWIIPINGRFQVILMRFLRLFIKYRILISGHAGVGFEDRFNLIIGKPDIFVAITPLAYKWAKKISSKSKIVQIPNGINISQFSKEVEPAQIDLPKPVILCVSALLPYKRIEFLIDAVSRLKNGNLLLIGGGELRSIIELLGKEKLNDRFLLFPHIPHKDIDKYYKAADLFSLPSKESEAFGLVYLEALACNLPIVAPDDENRRYIIGDAGLYCDPEDIKQYAKTIKDALQTDFADKPRKQAEKFSWEKIAVEYEKVLN